MTGDQIFCGKIDIVAGGSAHMTPRPTRSHSRATRAHSEKVYAYDARMTGIKYSVLPARFSNVAAIKIATNSSITKIP
jgi:hypothetical protein